MSDIDTGLPVAAIAEYLSCDDPEETIKRANIISNMAFDFMQAARLEAAGRVADAELKRAQWYA